MLGFNFIFYYFTGILDIKLIFNGTRYTFIESVQKGYIEPLILHGNNQDSTSQTYIAEDTATALNGGLLPVGTQGSSTVKYVFKTKVNGFKGVSLNYLGTPDSYRHLMLTAMRNFDISLSKAE